MTAKRYQIHPGLLRNLRAVRIGSRPARLLDAQGKIILGSAKAPAQFASGQWSASTGLAATEIVLNVSALPSDGGSPITALEYNIGAGWVELIGNGTGARVLQMPSAGAQYNMVIRAVSAVGSGPASEMKSVTSGAEIVAPPEAPQISIASGGGYAGSTYTSTVAGQWTANDVDIPGETGASWTMTREHEGAVIRCGGSNAIRMWMPTDLDAGTKLIWADPKRQQSAGTGFVSQLADQFGTNDFVQSSPSLRPVANTEGGDPFISFNSGTYLESTDAIPTPYIAFVSRYKTGVETAFETYHVLIGDAAGHRVQGDGFNATQWNSGPLRKNGGAAGLVALPMPKSLFMGVPARAATVANIWLGSTAPRWNGGLWEFIALSAVPTEADRLILEGCMAHRNGIAASLPSGHPYKLTGPQVAVAAPATEEWAMAAGDGSVTVESSPSDPEPTATPGDGSITTG
ncbi:hypothetical protein [Thioclava sp.]|uniref:hypothetical protein n=1 Tax=Thioclava sp. TaxID=1933450 RepID=UPI0032425293